MVMKQSDKNYEVKHKVYSELKSRAANLLKKRFPEEFEKIRAEVYQEYGYKPRRMGR